MGKGGSGKGGGWKSKARVSSVGMLVGLKKA